MAIYLCGLPGGATSLLRTGRPYLTFDLAPDGVYPATTVTCSTGALLPHRFTLTCAPGGAIGGLLSVALACVSPRLAVSQHRALRSPDLPQPQRTGAATTRPTHRSMSVLAPLVSPGFGCQTDLMATKTEALVSITGVGPALANRLIRAGYDTVPKVARASAKSLAQVQGLSEVTARKVIAAAKKVKPAKKAAPKRKPAKKAAPKRKPAGDPVAKRIDALEKRLAKLERELAKAKAPKAKTPKAKAKSSSSKKKSKKAKKSKKSSKK